MGKIKSINFHGIKRRWFTNSLMVISAVVIAAFCIVAIVTYSNLYGSLRSALEQRSMSVARYFNSYLNSSYSEYYSGAKLYAEEFTEKNLLELQFLNTSGRINVSSTGILSGQKPGTSDISDAMSERKTSVWAGNDPSTGERIMAVSSPLFYANSQIIGVVRMVTSLRVVDHKLMIVLLVSAAIAMTIFIFVVLTNRYFIRSIVVPLAEISDIAKKISEGSYGATISKKFDDEIGELADTINHMSSEILNAEKLKNDFISSISHELRTPLTAISGWGETIMYMDDPKDMKDGVTIIISEAKRLTSLVEEMLELTALQGGRLKMQMEQMDIPPEFEDVLFLYKDILSKEGIKLEYQCDDDIPTISGDKEKLKQVFYNLLDNAAKHGGSGKRISVAIHFDGEYILISVRDYGNGIPEDDLPLVKKKFYKGSSSQRGSGIGLAVANEIVEMHSGELEILSTVGEGTTVTVKLPLSFGTYS